MTSTSTPPSVQDSTYSDRAFLLTNPKSLASFSALVATEDDPDSAYLELAATFALCDGENRVATLDLTTFLVSERPDDLNAAITEIAANVLGVVGFMEGVTAFGNAYIDAASEVIHALGAKIEKAA
jgi:hypothetical protein